MLCLAQPNNVCNKDLLLIYIIKTKLTWLVMGSVLIWHMYNPLSLRCTTSISNVQELWPLWLTLMRGLLVTIWVWMAKMAFESDRSHATFKNNKNETIMFDTHEGIIRQHMGMNGQNGLWIWQQPCNPWKNRNEIENCDQYEWRLGVFRRASEKCYSLSWNKTKVLK